QIVRVFVAQCDAIGAFFDDVLFVESMLGAPAEVDALGAALHLVAADNGTLRARAGMHREPDAVVEMAVLHQHIVRDAPDDAVAVEVAHGHAAHGDAIAFIQANGAVVERALVEHGVLGLVAVDGDVLNDHVRDIGALDQCKIGGDLRITAQVETLLQATIQLEALARGGDQRSLNNVGAFPVGVLGDQADAVTDLKSLRLGERYFLVPMVAVERDFAGHAWFFDQHRIGPASQESDFGLQEYRVPQSVFTGKHPNGAAAFP